MNKDIVRTVPINAEVPTDFKVMQRISSMGVKIIAKREIVFENNRNYSM